MRDQSAPPKLAKPSVREVPVQYPSSSETPLGENSRHASAVISIRNALDLHFKDRPEVFVTSGMAVWYEIGVEFAVQPDVLVALDVWRGERRIYYPWVEGKVPDFVLDVIRSKYHPRWDNEWKYGTERYEEFGIRECVLFDPGYEDNSSRMRMCRMVENRRVEVEPDETGEFQSEVLGLGLTPERDRVRIRDLKSGKVIPSLLELDQALAAEREARQAESRARQEAEATIAELEVLVAGLNQR